MKLLLLPAQLLREMRLPFYIKDQLCENKILVISRIAYGVPMGGELEYVDNTTLGRAIQVEENKLMAIKSDKWIIEQAQENQLITPFLNPNK